MNLNKIGFVICFLLVFPITELHTQTGDYSISGFISDAVTGEALVGTNILIYKDSLNFERPPITGAATNRFGYYAIPELQTGTYLMIIRYLGYKTSIRDVTITGNAPNLNYSVELYPEDIELGEVLVEGERQDKPITSTIDIPPELLTKLPTLSGEVDLFKSLEMLPGVNRSSEISSGLYVRGGSPDQTLTLVDGVIVYNPAHLGNIASTFNSNALSDVRLIKGAFPAEYGGRLSSVLDVKLRSGTKEKDKGTLGLGLINSFAAFEGPFGSKSTYMISGRVMYYDLLQSELNNSSTIPLYNFFDLNAKINYVLSESNIISISGLYSHDHAYNPPTAADTDYDIEWENINLSLNWLQVNTSSLLLNSILSFIKYKFSSKIGINPTAITSYNYFSNSNLTDIYIRQNAELRWHQDHTLKLGFDLASHNYDLLYSDAFTEALEKDPYAGKDITSIEASLYFQTESQLTSKLKTNLGGRFYYFSNQKFLRFEPRVSASYSFTPNFILKGAFAVAHQFLHLIVRNDITLPTDLWFPSTKHIQPGRSTQYVLGFDTYWFDQTYTFTVEGFYKDMQSLYEFRNSPQLNPLDDSIEDQFTQGQGEAYGIELFLSKQKGDFTGWIGYTLAWSDRQFDDLNGGKIYNSRYDRRHDFSVVFAYNLFNDFNVGLTWVYATGQRYTLPPGQFIFDPVGVGGSQEVQFNYTGINTAQFPAYHKLDLNVNYSFKWFNSDFEAYINLYNVYNKYNTFAQYVVLKESAEGEKVPVVKQIALFPFIPSAGIAIKF